MENLQTKIYSFEYILKKTIEKAWSPLELEERFSTAVAGANTLVDELIRLGDFCYKKLQSVDSNAPNNTEDTLLYMTNFIWLDRAKSLLILWRDILFEQYKASILLIDGKISQSDLVNLNWQSKVAINKAKDELLTVWEDESKALINGNEKTINERITRWKLQLNPWPIYKEQLARLPKQCKQLAEQNQSLKLTATNILEIRKSILNLMMHVEEDMELSTKNAKETHQFILEHIEEKPRKIAVHLEHLEGEIKKTDRLKLLVSELDKNIEQLVERLQVPVATQNGLLSHKETDFKRTVRQWMDAEILPILYEFGELSDNIHNALKMSLINIRNRAILLNNEIKEGRQANWNKEDLCQPLISFLKKTEGWEEDISSLKKIIDDRLGDSLYASAVYNTNEEFLAIPLQSTLNNFRNNPNQVLVKVQEWTDKKMGVIRKFKSSVEEEDSLSTSEKIVRYIENHTVDPNNNQYSSIFLTKGFIGESFWVGREKNLDRISKLIKQWKKGFRGAVMLTGQRLSGKSLFGDYVTTHQFPQNTIKLIPNTSIELHGRIFNIDYDLGAALIFIKKYAINTNPVIWIDDLELWRNDQIPLNQNVRTLSKFIDSDANRIFFMVSMNNWVKAQLDKTSNISKVFQAEINLDRMDFDEIKEAILIRHGATHKVLVNKEGKESTPQQFKKMTSRVYKSAEGNIGEALQQWVFSIEKIDDENVIYKNQYFHTLPDIIDSDTALLLATIMMEKRTNDRHLRKLFGPAYNDKYRSSIQRLISIGLLKRHIDGWLEINEVAANELGKLLERKQYLKFYQ